MWKNSLRAVIASCFLLAAQGASANIDKCISKLLGLPGGSCTVNAFHASGDGTKYCDVDNPCVQLNEICLANRCYDKRMQKTDRVPDGMVFLVSQGADQKPMINSFPEGLVRDNLLSRIECGPKGSGLEKVCHEVEEN